MQTREYSTTGQQLSIVAFAGIVVKDETAENSSRYVSWAIDQGINYFDVAPGYGNAQNMLGPALEQYRNDVFLACKTNKREAVSARAELEDSLKLLRTDHFDLYQMHAMTTQEDLEVATGPGGALEMFVKAREEGLVKHLGFSAHSAEVAVELMNRFDFDSVLFPVNFTTWFESGFGPQIMNEAEQLGVARLALKGASHHALEDRNHKVREKCWYAPIEDRELLKLALRWTLSQPIVAAIPPGDPELWQMAVEVAQHFTTITPDEEEELRENARGRAPLFELAHA
ncbi:MAG TPA: aldo/keto reductase [Dehalococcoidia bacterium]|nr:aldo/keto reductase [Dehalococcoidia bacterium]HIK89551.1 aldo/keto reductase [Dehalococcoidia bacterium]